MNRYNKDYNRWVSEDGTVYRMSKTYNKLVPCKSTSNHGYALLSINGNKVYAHRLVWETFNGAIPDGMEIDHINSVRDDNRISNLRCVTHSENMLNPLIKEHQSKPRTKFGKLFLETYNMTNKEAPTLYNTEYAYYKRHGVLKGKND